MGVVDLVMPSTRKIDSFVTSNLIQNFTNNTVIPVTQPRTFGLMKDSPKLFQIASALQIPPAGYRHFFAYDELMSERKLKRICPSPIFLGVAYYESRRWLINSAGVPTITPRKGYRVYGVVWRLHDVELAALDIHQRVPQKFDRLGSLATLVDGRRCSSEYYATRDRQPGMGAAGEIAKIVRLGRQLGFPEAYIEELGSWSAPGVGRAESGADSARRP